MKKLFLLSALLIFAFGFGQTAEDYFDSGYIKYEAKDNYGAINDFSKAIELNPNLIDAYYNRGLAKFITKDYYGAISDFTKIIENSPNFVQAHKNRGIAKYYINDFNGACEDAKKARSLGVDTSKLIEATCK